MAPGAARAKAARGRPHTSARSHPVTVEPEQVTDWAAIVGDDVMLGNFTTMELRRPMSSKERSQLDRMMGYRILADSAIIALPQQ